MFYHLLRKKITWFYYEITSWHFIQYPKGKEILEKCFHLKFTRGRKFQFLQLWRQRNKACNKRASACQNECDQKKCPDKTLFNRFTKKLKDPEKRRKRFNVIKHLLGDFRFFIWKKWEKNCLRKQSKCFPHLEEKKIWREFFFSPGKVSQISLERNLFSHFVFYTKTLGLEHVIICSLQRTFLKENCWNFFHVWNQV